MIDGLVAALGQRTSHRLFWCWLAKVGASEEPGAETPGAAKGRRMGAEWTSVPGEVLELGLYNHALSAANGALRVGPSDADAALDKVCDLIRRNILDQPGAEGAYLQAAVCARITASTSAFAASGQGDAARWACRALMSRLGYGEPVIACAAA